MPSFKNIVILMKYYSAVKKNEIMQFAATWMDLEIIILNEMLEKDKYMISLICGIKNDTNEFIYKIERDLQTLKTNVWLPKGKEAVGKEWVGSLGLGYAYYCIWSGWPMGTSCIA